MRSVLIFLAISSIFITCTAQEPWWMKFEYWLQSFTFHNIPAAQNVSIAQYSGLWYDYAHIPFYWQEDCYCTKAYYAPLTNGGVLVNNTCLKGSVQGKMSFNVGKAYQAGDIPSELAVEFFNLVAAPYWILEVAEDYSHALVGSPALDYLWILSRTPTLDSDIYNNLVNKAESMGFPTNKLVFTEQIGCPN